MNRKFLLCAAASTLWLVNALIAHCGESLSGTAHAQAMLHRGQGVAT